MTAKIKMLSDVTVPGTNGISKTYRVKPDGDRFGIWNNPKDCFSGAMRFPLFAAADKYLKTTPAKTHLEILQAQVQAGSDKVPYKTNTTIIAAKKKLK